MKLPFREHHLFLILAAYEKQDSPLDLFLSHYFRSHKSIGSKDRQAICKALYDLIRWRGLFDHLCEKPTSWEKRYQVYKQRFSSLPVEDPSLPPHVRISFPKEYFHKLVASYGEETARTICLISNEPAPTTLRINPIKTTRDSLFTRWKDLHRISLCELSPLGIHFLDKINFRLLEEFKEGLFEIQDEGSQLIASLVQARPSQQVLDFCAGSGGKTLAFAHQMEGKGQIYLHDRRFSALQEAKKRLRRAGIQNAQILPPNDPKKESLHGTMDWILLDVPCSGSGTLRRNPDMKWKFSLDQLTRLVAEQKEIGAQALPFLKKGGHIVYATCSLFPDENEKQIETFLASFPLSLEKKVSWLPEKGGRDGFFGAVLKGLQ